YKAGIIIDALCWQKWIFSTLFFFSSPDGESNVVFPIIVIIY
ncbi:MAG: hypothetical protein ACI9BD_000977, partial [Candidatus Marinamargulisbacteria bacterium]